MAIKPKSVLQINSEGIIINSFPSIRAAAKKLGCHKSSIAAACLGESITSVGFAWCYSDAYISKEYYIALFKKSQLVNKQRVENLNKLVRRRRKVYKKNINGEIVETFVSVGKAIKSVSGTYNRIISAAESNAPYKGFYWQVE